MSSGKIHLYCGDGKGKTTAAMGLALRAAGSGRRVVIVQFLKDCSSHEVQVLQKLPGVTVLGGKVCNSFSWQMTPEQKAATRALHIENFHKAVGAHCDLLVLDEICGAVEQGLMDEAAVDHLLQNKPEGLELVLTGRNPSPAMEQAADYLTQMVKRKHPFDQGLPAREGIEY